MSNNLYTKIYNFLVNAPQEHITAGSVIYQGIEENSQIPKNELRDIIEQAVALAKHLYKRGSPHYICIIEILTEVCYRFYVKVHCWG